MKKSSIKKLFAVLLAGACIGSNLVSPLPALAEDEISVKINGSLLSFDVPPQIINGRTMVPMRKIFETLGANVEWNDELKLATTKSAKGINMCGAGYRLMYVNGTPKLLDVPPMIIGGRTMVPARAISEAMGCDVNWNASTRTVSIVTTEVLAYNNFVEGYEQASKDKLRQYELSNLVNLKEDGNITEVKVREIYDSKYDSVIMATIVGTDGSVWNWILSPLNDDESNKHDFDSFVGKSVVAVGEFYGVLSDFKNPIIVTHKMAEFRGSGTIYDRDVNPTSPIINKVEEKTLYGANGVVFTSTIRDEETLKKLCIYNEPKISMFSEDGEIKIVSESEKGKYEAEGWFEDFTPHIMYSDDNKLHFVKDDNYEARKAEGWHSSPLITMYAADGRTIRVEETERTLYKDNGWFITQPVTMYATDGRTISVEQDEVENYKNVGWYTSPTVTMYAADGRTIDVEESQIEDYKNVGWYTVPMTTMYAADGRTIVVESSQVASYQNVGWYTEPVVTLYSLDGRTLVVPESQASDYTKVGWYRSQKDVTQEKNKIKLASLVYDRSKTGSISGVITYKYNDFVGNRGDTGAKILLVQTNHLPTFSDFLNIGAMSTTGDDPTVYTTIVDGTGHYQLDNIPAGEYYLVIESKETKESYDIQLIDRKIIRELFTGKVSDEAIRYLELGDGKKIIKTINIQENQTFRLDKDWGITAY